MCKTFDLERSFCELVSEENELLQRLPSSEPETLMSPIPDNDTVFKEKHVLENDLLQQWNHSTDLHQELLQKKLNQRASQEDNLGKTCSEMVSQVNELLEWLPSSTTESQDLIEILEWLPSSTTESQDLIDFSDQIQSIKTQILFVLVHRDSLLLQRDYLWSMRVTLTFTSDIDTLIRVCVTTWYFNRVIFP